MKIYVLTFHKAFSYGACLQAYATWKYFQNKGIECKFIDYENSYEARMRNGNWYKYESLKNIIQIIIKKVFFKYNSCCKTAYKKFHNELPAICPEDIESDAILAVGSDQVWNAEICNGIDEAYYLTGFSNRKISLASSAGGYRFTDEENKKVCKWLAEFSDISVRESFVREQLEKNMQKRISVILDPTFWLSAQEWKNEIKSLDIPAGNYILVFLFNNVNIRESDEIVHYYRTKMKIPAYRIMLNNYNSQKYDKILAGITPWEFLEYIANASLVITNSFHGVAFSINLNTPFVFIPVNYENNFRITELLKSVNLLGRCVDKVKNVVEETMDFEEANRLLSAKREETMKWLEYAVRENIDGDK